MRIVKAWQEGRRRKVKTLQRMLTRSLSGKALAVKRVTENQGKKIHFSPTLRMPKGEARTRALLEAMPSEEAITSG